MNTIANSLRNTGFCGRKLVTYLCATHPINLERCTLAKRMLRSAFVRDLMPEKTIQYDEAAGLFEPGETVFRYSLDVTSSTVSDYCEYLAAKTYEYIEGVKRLHSPEKRKEASQAMWDFYEEMRIPSKELDRRRMLAEGLSHVIRERATPACLKDSSLIVIGSSYTRCSDHWSDLDMCIFSHELETHKKVLRKMNLGADAHEYLEHVRHALIDTFITVGKNVQEKDAEGNKVQRGKRWILKPNRLRLVPAGVPILRFTLKTMPGKEMSSTDEDRLMQKPIECDINIMNTVGIYNSYLIKCYQEWDARFPALLMIVKRVADALGFKSAKDGLFGSYALSLMVIHFLQTGILANKNTPILPNMQELDPRLFSTNDNPADLLYFRPYPRRQEHTDSKNEGIIDDDKDGLYELMIAFFYYFSLMDTQKFGVSVRLGGLIELRSNMLKPPVVFLEEPFLETNAASAAVRGRYINAGIRNASSLKPLRLIDILETY